jgi:outer membrane autotransporter protein
LLAAATAHEATAATVVTREFRSPGSSTSTLTFNVIDNGLANGAVRPLQVSAVSVPVGAGLTVTRRLNCISVSGFLDTNFQVQYTVVEGDGSAPDSGTLTFNPASNSPPATPTTLADANCVDRQHTQSVAVADTVTSNRDTPIAIQVLANDANVTANVTRIVIDTQPQNGTAVVQGNTIQYTPAAGFTGTNTLTYSLSDYSLDPDYRSPPAQVTINVVVPPNQAPVASAGPDQTLADSDLQPGESVVLDGRGSTDADGTIATYLWRNAAGTQIATGPNPTVSLPDGNNLITLTVTDNLGATGSDTVAIDVAVPPQRATLSELTNLTPNQKAMAATLDDVCARLSAIDVVGTEEEALLQRCNGLLFNTTAEEQRTALDELNAEDFAAARTQTLLFANFQFAGVMDRLIALRGGARGLSLAGLDIVVDGKQVPLAELQDIAKKILSGGASGDADEPGGLLSDKWGLWGRGNYSFGEKDASTSAPGFDADQWALLAGIDYRLSDRAVLGLALGYGDSSVEFDPSGEGGLDTTSWAASFYGSMYAARNFYLDAILNVADVSYDARRNITYVDGFGLVAEEAHGDTDGLTWSGGASLGYDFLIGGLTVSPTLGAFYIDASIDGFTETGATGINLVYDDQDFESLTGTLGLRFTYAWNLSWGVLLPHLRTDFVREFEDDVEVFGVRFAADPFTDVSNPTPPILVRTENPDTSYWRLAAGFSAQFKYGVSGYIEYQRLEGYDLIEFQDVSLGLRFQHSF